MDAFADLRDPCCRTCRYPLQEILFAALSAVLCGVEDWETTTLWARTKLPWLRTHLPVRALDSTFKIVGEAVDLLSRVEQGRLSV